MPVIASLIRRATAGRIAFVGLFAGIALLEGASSSLAGESHPLEPAEALSQFELEEGLTIELVAAEPLVDDPVAMAFDHLGRLYVADYRDYPLGPEPGQPALSRVKLLEDTDGNGVFDKSTVFADVPWVQGVIAHRNGVIVTASPQVLYLEDTNGDGVADIREVLLDGFTFGNPQLRVGHPRRGFDQRLFLTNGLTGGKITVPGAEAADALTMGRSDLKYDPATRKIELVPGQAQFGNTLDDAANRFFCTNRNPIIYAPLTQHSINRNPAAPVLTVQEDVAPSGGASRVYPGVETKTTASSHAGTHTAACGTHVYRGANLGYNTTDELNVFVCEPTGSLVTRTILTPNGMSFKSQRPYDRKDFLTSKDPWFRPTSFTDGPDGCLYLADMYREVIEHPQYMPAGLAETLRLREGDDRGRIYRIRRTSQPWTKWTPFSTTEELLMGMQDGNGWKRDLAQRRLLETATADNTPALVIKLEELLKHADPRVVSHALWTLAGLERQGLLPKSQLAGDLDPLFQHVSPFVVEKAIQLAIAADLTSPALLQIPEKTPGISPRVAFHWIDAVASSSDPAVQQEIGKLVARFSGDTWIRRLALTLPPEQSASLLVQLLKSPDFLKKGQETELELFSYLAGIVGRRAVRDEVVAVLTAVDVQNVPGLPWWRSATLFGLDQGLAGGKGLDGKKQLGQLASADDQELAARSAAAVTVLATSLQTLIDQSAPMLDRRAAVPTLGKVSLEAAIDAVKKILTGDADVLLQRASMTIVSGRGIEPLMKELLAAWKNLGPGSRGLVIEFAMTRPATMTLMLQEMVDGKISPALVTIEQRDLFFWSKNPVIVEMATKLYGGATSKDRDGVIERYQPALTLAGNSEKGREVFRRVCAQCHKIGNDGFLVGPDLSDIRAKEKRTLMSDILDPSRAVEPRWTSYVAAMEDGRLITGLLVGENASTIMLRKAKGVEESLVRSEIEVLKASDQSLMPSGIESEVSVEQMADLLSFLKSGR